MLRYPPTGDNMPARNQTLGAVTHDGQPQFSTLQGARVTTLMAYPDPLIHSVVNAAQSLLQKLGQNAEGWDTLAAAGTHPGEAMKMTKAESRALHDTARVLYDRGEFAHAVQVAVCALACDPADSGYAYLAGRCLQQLGQFETAAAVFLAALEIDSTKPAAAFRLGQCLERLGKPDAARHAFEHAVECGRADPSLRQVQDVALASLAAH